MASRRAARRFPDGFLALDYFGDADLVSLAATGRVRALSLRRDCGLPRGVEALARAALHLDWRGLVYSGGIESRPALLRRLERRGPLLGNGSAVVAAVRDPARFFPFLRRAGIPHPPTFAGRGRPVPASGFPCLWKPIRSGGGARIRRALPGELRPRGFYRQVFLRGSPGSAAFVADGRRAALLGVTRQLVGFRALGGEGFRYGGNIAGPSGRLLTRKARRVLADAVAGITRRFGLRGLNGIDFVLSGGVPHILEINPRYTASMELFEELSGSSLFDLHLEAVERGRLPGCPRAARRFLAKGILYATGRVVWPWSGVVAGIDARDRPMQGERIERGHPVCTLVVSGGSPAECRRRLEAAGARVRRGLLDSVPEARRVTSVSRHGTRPSPALRQGSRSVLR